MNPAYDDAIELLADGGAADPLALARGLCGIEIPHALSHVADAIEKSRYILDLPDDWDDEGSPAYALETWERAVRFVLKNAAALWRSERMRVAAPAIHNGPAGSIDLHWKTGGTELLVNVPPILERPATYYGRHADSGLETKGSLETSASNEWLLRWVAQSSECGPRKKSPATRRSTSAYIGTTWTNMECRNLAPSGILRPNRTGCRPIGTAIPLHTRRAIARGILWTTS